MSQISSHYPNDILKPENEYRSIKMLVKDQTSLSGGIGELKKQVDKVKDQLGSIVDGATSGPSGEGAREKLSVNVKKLVKAQTVWGIALPLPNELNDSQAHQWDTSKGFVGQVGGSLANKDIGMGLSANSVMGELASAAGFRKPLIDPGYFQDYNGTEPREFTFTWDLIPNNAEETDSIETILYNLKKYTVPKSTVSGVSMLSPYMFDIQIGNPKINRLMNMNNVVCKSMSISYSADGSLQFLHDGIPKYTRLEMSFAERSLVTADFY